MLVSGTFTLNPQASRQAGNYVLHALLFPDLAPMPTPGANRNLKLLQKAQ